jgi:hypothetical protein
MNKNSQKNIEYSICIVTYHARFENYFKPLIKKISKIFPEKEILCIANGHPDKTLQISYLNNFTKFCKNIKNIRYLTNDSHQSLAKCWNQLLILSGSELNLILNDDTQVTELFREEFENKIINNNIDFTTINGSWSHFLISKKIIWEIGWFDENLLGIGHEDTDYMCRMAISGIKEIKDTNCLGIKNYVAPATNPSFKEISEITDGKYSLSNKIYIEKKYKNENKNNQAFEYYWKNSKNILKVDNNIPTQDFYQKEKVLINEEKKIILQNKKQKNIIILQKIYFNIISFLKKIKHYKTK